MLEHIRHGLRNRGIAAVCAISEETVQTHVKNILLKLDAQDRTAAVNVALTARDPPHRLTSRRCARRWRGHMDNLRVRDSRLHP